MMRNFCKLALFSLACFIWNPRAQAAVLYQWGLDGTGVPSVTAGGGTLTVSNSTNGSSYFSSTGGWTGQPTDGYYASGGTNPGTTNQYGTADPAGVAATSSGNVLTGLGTLGSFTVTMFVNPAEAWGTTSGTAAINNSRLMMLGPSGYDEGTSSPGFALAINNGNAFQVAIGGQSFGINPTLASNAGSISSTLTGASQSANTGQWVFVAFSYDGSATGANPYADSAISSATGGAEANNDYLYIADAGNSNLILMTPNTGAGAIQSGNNSPGAVAFGSAAYAYLGNRSSLSRDFLGGIDDVSIYNGILSQSQLDALNTVPEPASLGLMSLCALALLQRRSRA